MLQKSSQNSLGKEQSACFIPFQFNKKVHLWFHEKCSCSSHFLYKLSGSISYKWHRCSYRTSKDQQPVIQVTSQQWEGKYLDARIVTDKTTLCTIWSIASGTMASSSKTLSCLNRLLKGYHHFLSVKTFSKWGPQKVWSSHFLSWLGTFPLSSNCMLVVGNCGIAPSLARCWWWSTITCKLRITNGIQDA